jgi:hypothetical protein
MAIYGSVAAFPASFSTSLLSNTTLQKSNPTPSKTTGYTSTFQGTPLIARPRTGAMAPPETWTSQLRSALSSNGNGNAKVNESTDVPTVREEPRLGTHGKPLYTTLGGHPVSDDNNSLTIGESGTITLEDLHLLEKQAHMNRERVPERVVHAKGAGAHGYFEVTKYVPSFLQFLQTALK